ncbi:Microtubule integrity protein mal3 [Choanephora cucurbitarum]|uniref:Microtubule integrity protein mal3 n=1 Tax=Choanephora cucurbitarum TaxID=101091 RepID=A0A1C7NPC5_9FUNG|nr:Microtubule integrity protein mal3 [Choanephora cucurbitarum]
MGESRTELLAWLNELLQTRYTKIEQAGTGAAYCQIFDSIYGDVPVGKVKFEAKLEYEYVNNYKILQNVFKKHKVDKIVPVDRLIKCKLQDNLEFMQWVKRFWDQNYPGGEYDALARRKGGAPSTRSSTTSTVSSGRVSSASKKATKTPAARSASRGGRTSVLDNHSASMIIDLNKQISELKLTVDGLEKERDFYFNKLREIEIDVQENMEQLEISCAETERNPEEHEAFPVLQSIQTILYSTEEGFEVPPEDEEAKEEALEYDDETF